LQRGRPPRAVDVSRGRSKESSLFRWLTRPPRGDTIRALYGAIVAQARAPAFYTAYGVGDTVAGRFEMIVLHLALFVRRLRREPEPIRGLGQEVFDLFCLDMDHSLREMGIGDLGVAKHMRRVAEAFYGRAAAYDDSIDRPGEEPLAAALARNVFSTQVPAPCARRLARYVRAAIGHLEGQGGGAFARAVVTFPDPGTISASA
jgi:cytochrome b pre-mRNA-processing protein 3